MMMVRWVGISGIVCIEAISLGLPVIVEPPDQRGLWMEMCLSLPCKISKKLTEFFLVKSYFQIIFTIFKFAPV